MIRLEIFINTIAVCADKEELLSVEDANVVIVKLRYDDKCCG
jgi:hypothetical protein